MKRRPLIVFDMDGVLIDVSGSYRNAVRQTAQLFFGPCPDSQNLPHPLFSLSDLATVKQSGGLNNDWDLTCFIIDMLFELVNAPKISTHADPWLRYQETLSGCQTAELARFLSSNKRPLANLLKKRDKPQNAFVLSLFKGDVGSGNVIKQIFQEIYLGKDLFAPIYGMAPRLFSKQGLIHREQLLLAPSALSFLAQRNILAIATGRPQKEAEYPLKRFNIQKHFSCVYTLDDCLEEEKKLFQTKGIRVSLSKPDPFMLDTIADMHKESISDCFYIGDMPDDMKAAVRSKTGFLGVGFVASAPDKGALRGVLSAAGAHRVVENEKELTHLFGP